ncbi:uncharacterized protein HKW66_Vig0115050 [Vigna angularis]|uniref:Uncharacterized protein n=1 Tax=Phaseolus angularis TaxID=3914 RepID=A0A8T0L2F7_PHAAN|nr:uncharacterized protein HKW66_Vig0115050 [Vigna angularis]
MGDKDIVKRAFKPFQNSFNQLKASYEDKSSIKKQVTENLYALLFIINKKIIQCKQYCTIEENDIDLKMFLFNSCAGSFKRDRVKGSNIYGFEERKWTVKILICTDNEFSLHKFLFLLYISLSFSLCIDIHNINISDFHIRFFIYRILIFDKFFN